MSLPHPVFPARAEADSLLNPLGSERAAMGRIAGFLWLLAAVAGSVGLFLPGADRSHLAVALVMAAVVALYGAASILDWIPFSRAGLRTHALATAAGLVVVGVAFWATGGARSYLVPVLPCVLLYVAYFFPPGLAWPLVAGLVVCGASPLLYDSRAITEGFASRTLMMAVSYVAVTACMEALKRRLVDAEARQREMAVEDALTGAGNRRAFDQRLARELEGRGLAARGRRAADLLPSRFALLFIDVDRFKAINDDHGHQVGDNVLRDLARHIGAVVRPGDQVSRIGGDEFAVIAPSCGHAGAERLARAIAGAAADVAPAVSAEPVAVTVAWSVYPADGQDASALMRVADRRLHDGKRPEGPRPRPEPQPEAAEPAGWASAHSTMRLESETTSPSSVTSTGTL